MRPVKACAPARGVTQLYGARGNKQIRRPHGRSLAPLWSNPSSFEGKFTVLKKVLVTLLGLFGAFSNNSAPPAIIRRPCSDSAPP